MPFEDLRSLFQQLQQDRAGRLKSTEPRLARFSTDEIRSALFLPKLDAKTAEAMATLAKLESKVRRICA